MGQKHREVDILRPVSVADAPYFLRGFPDIHQGADQFFQFGLLQHFFRQDTDKQHLHPAGLQDSMGTEQTPAIVFQVHIGVNDGKVGTFFQKQKMGQPVIYFVVTNGNHIRSQQVHNLNS